MPVDIERLRALLAAATDRPWKACGAHNGGCTCGVLWSEKADLAIMTRVLDVKDPHGEVMDRADDWSLFNPHNTSLIAEAVNALPALLDELEALRARVPPDASVWELVQGGDERF